MARVQITVATAGSDRAEQQVRRLDQAVGQLGRQSPRIKIDTRDIDRAVGAAISGAKSIERAFLVTGGAIGAASGFAAKAGLDFAILEEQAGIAFKTMLGGADAAQKHLEQLKDFAAKTPFELPGLIKADQRLLAFGFSAQQVLPILTNVGDAIAGLGGGEMELDRVIRAFGQIQAKGRVMAEEMMQLTEAGIPAWDILAKKLNTDVATAMDMVTKRQVDSGTAMQAFMEGMQSRFGGLMREQSTSLGGMLSNLRDQWKQATGETVAAFDAPMKRAIQTATDALAEFRSESTPQIEAFAGDLDRIWADSGKSFEERFAATWDRIAETGLPERVSDAILGGLKTTATEGPRVLWRAFEESPLLGKAAITAFFLSRFGGAFAALGKGLGGALGGALGGGGKGGGVLGALAELGRSPARPMYVWVVNGGAGAGGIPGVGGGVAGGASLLSRAVPVIGAVAGVAIPLAMAKSAREDAERQAFNDRLRKMIQAGTRIPAGTLAQARRQAVGDEETRQLLASYSPSSGGFWGRVSETAGGGLRGLASRIAAENGLDPGLFVAQIQQESGFNPRAVSSAGAMGLGQLMPGTARGLGVKDPFNAEENLRGAARYMREQLKRFGGDYALALAAYNAGPERVAAAKGIPRIKETQDYVAKIMGSVGRSMTGGAATGNLDIAALFPSTKSAADQEFFAPLDTPMGSGSEFATIDAEGAPDASGTRRHAGKDWFAAAGAPVRAPAAGRIVEVKQSSGSSGQVFGGVVKIQVGGSPMVFVFRHVVPARGLAVGKQVRAGEVVATVSPWTGGKPHAHIEVWKTLQGGYRFDNMLDPTEVLKGAPGGYVPELADSLSLGGLGTLDLKAPRDPSPTDVLRGRLDGLDATAGRGVNKRVADLIRNATVATYPGDRGRGGKTQRISTATQDDRDEALAVATREAEITLVRRKLAVVNGHLTALRKQKKRLTGKAGNRAALRALDEQERDAEKIRRDLRGRLVDLTGEASAAGARGDEALKPDADTPDGLDDRELRRLDAGESTLERRAESNAERAARDRITGKGVKPDDVNDQRVRLEGDRARAEKRREYLTKRIGIIERTAERVRADIATISGRIARKWEAARQTPRSLASRRARLAQEARDLEADRRRLEDELEGLGWELDDLRMDADEVGLQIKDLDTDIARTPETNTASKASDGPTEGEMAAKRAQALSESFIQAAFGIGDLGEGGRTALQAAAGPGVTVNINALDSGSPSAQVDLGQRIVEILQQSAGGRAAIVQGAT